MKDRIFRAAGFLAALVFIIVLSPEPQFFRITFVGDVMLGRGIQSAAERSKDWRPFQDLEPSTYWSDVLAANLESPLTIAPPQTGGYMLCARPEMVSALKTASFDLVTLANNHILDCGEAGKDQTHLTLSGMGIHPVGPDAKPVYINLRGRLAGFIALDDVTRAVDVPSVLPLVEEAARRADPLIISIHWGSEYQPSPAPRQRALASMLANAGADVIIGHHPHVVQPMEFLPRGTDQPPAIVFYSLGNALFDQHGLPDTRTGALVNLNFGPGGTLLYSVETFEIDPVNGVIRRINP
ncbi:MAG: CapA family protein [Leptolinea sp.]|nr:CapA family protein [Leptolinea sp.]